MTLNTDTLPTAIAQLNDALTQTAESQRALMQEMAQFAKDESLRFVNLRLERNGHVMEQLQSCSGLPGLFGVQQEWLRDMISDYAAQNMRLAGAMRGVAQTVMAKTGEAAQNAANTMQGAAQDMAQQAENGQFVSQPADNMTFNQETQH